MQKSKPIWLLSASAAFATLAAPSIALGQDTTSEEIIVTATKRAASVLDVPFSVNAQTAEAIERSGATSLEDLSRNVAGLAIQNLGPGQSQVSIRGVSAGQIVRDQPGVKEQVGVYLDESVVSLSLFTPDLDLYDLNRVETLRGPQGTLFGSGSVGGTIRYITNAPDVTEYEGSVEGNLNTIDEGGKGGHLKGMVNIPVADGTAALRIVGYHTEYGGFIDALREGGGIDEDVNSGERSGGRISFSVQPNDNVTITPRLVYQKVEADGFNRQEVYNLFANPFTTTRTPVTFQERQQFLLLDEEFRDEMFLADLTASFDFGAVELTSVSSFIDRDILVSRDASALTSSISIDFGSPAAVVLLPSNLRDTTHLEQFTQEVRLASNYEGRFQWLVGAFYSDVQRIYEQTLPTAGYDAGTGTAGTAGTRFPANSPYNSFLPYDITQFAIFGEASFDVTDRFTVTAGGRWYDFEEERAFISGGVFSGGDNRTDNTESDGFTPRVIVSYEATEQLTLNAQASQGFRLGGVNDPLNVPICTPQDLVIFGGYQSYDDETSWNYETGLKFGGSNITFSGAAFYNDIKDLQVTLDAGSCSSRISFNVPEAHAMGVEAEISSRFGGLEISLAGNWTEAEFDSTVRDGSGAVLGGLQEGNRLPSVPEYQLAATVAYYWPLDVGGNEAQMFVSTSAQHLGSRYTQPSDQVGNPRSFVSGLAFGGATGTGATVLDLELDPYTVANFQLGVEADDWALIGYVNNAFDENADLAFDRERGGRARLGFHTNQPRTIGVTARKSF